MRAKEKALKVLSKVGAPRLPNIAAPAALPVCGAPSPHRCSPSPIDPQVAYASEGGKRSSCQVGVAGRSKHTQPLRYQGLYSSIGCL